MVGPSSADGRKGVRIAVAGDKGTGKSTLIAAVESESFPKSVPRVLPPTCLLPNTYPDSVPLTLIDTPSSLAMQVTRNEELKSSDAVVLTYACDEIASFERVSTYWLPELQKLEVKAPVIVVGCKLDLRDGNCVVNLESLTANIMQQFTEVVICIECSAATLYQSVELTGEAVEFLNGTFRLLDTDKDGYLRSAEVDKLFETAPESPWKNAPYKDATEKIDMGYTSLNAFQSQWALMTLLDPSRTLANLIYVGYNGNPAAALHVTRRRSLDQKKQTTERNVFQCYVFGSKHAGKSTLLYSFLERPFSNNYRPTTVEQYAANVVELKGVRETRKILILREIPEDGLSKFFSKQDCLAACDVAVFVYDSSDEYSWKKSTDMLEQVVNQGEITGYRVPCLLIAAKDDLTPFPRAVVDSVKVTHELGIEAPIQVSMKLGDSSDVYSKIVNAAEQPHLSIPETKFTRKKKQNHQLLHHTLIFALVGAAMTVFGLSACRVRAGKKNTTA